MDIERFDRDGSSHINGRYVMFDSHEKYVADIELSRTELIKQNAALAAENERLEAVIKAAQEQEPFGYFVDIEYCGFTREKPKNFLDCTTALYAHPVPAQSPVDMNKQIGWVNTKYNSFFAPGELANTERNMLLIESGEIVRVYESSSLVVAVPEQLIYACTDPDDETTIQAHARGWNECREAMLAAAIQSHDRCPSHEPVGGNFVSCEYGDVWNSVPYTDGKAHERELSPAEFERQYEQVFHPIHEAYGVQDSGEDGGCGCSSCEEGFPCERARDSGVVDYE